MAVTSLSGGKKLEEALLRLAAKVRQPGTLRVGFQDGSTYPDGTLVAYIAAINEFGVPSHNQPPRPFFRNMIAEKSSGWGSALGRLLVSANYDAGAALGEMGQGIERQLRLSIVAFTSPPLAPSTIKRKGNSKPLVDTGQMLNSITSKVTT